MMEVEYKQAQERNSKSFMKFQVTHKYNLVEQEMSLLKQLEE